MEQKDVVQTLLPFLEATDIKQDFLFDSNSIHEIGGFYLFSIRGIVIPIEEDDVYRYIEKRFQSVLSAAHRANWTVLTAITGCSEGTKVNIGFKAPLSPNNLDSKVFERILSGLIPGLEFDLDKSVNVNELIKNQKYGGVIAGIPILKIDEERQQFRLSSVIRSLYGERYSLIIISKPVNSTEIASQLQHIWNIRDFCHEMAHQTKTQESGESKAMDIGYSKSNSSSDSKTNGKSFLFFNWSKSGQESTSKTYNYSMNISKSKGESLSKEQQNSVAKELEQIAGQYSDRLLRAVNIGEWESTITFATETKAAREILTGTLLGELSKPSTDVFPLRVQFGDLSENFPILLPNQDNQSNVFPRSLASYITSEELATISSPPVEHLPGYDIRRTPTLNLSDSAIGTVTKSQVLGSVCDHGFPLENSKIEIDSNILAKHLFVCGLTGTGKTTTVKEILLKCDVPFLILESAKRDYRQLLNNKKFKGDFKVYTVGDSSISPISMNPFYILPNISALTHIDFLKSIFNASFSLYGPMPYILEKCIHNIYLKRGWDLTNGIHPKLIKSNGEPDLEKYESLELEHLFPTIPDLKDEVQEYVKNELDYKGEISDNIRAAIITRLESLCVGSKGTLFGSTKPLNISELLKHPTVLELEALSDDDDKAFFVGLILTFISEFRQSNNPAIRPFAKEDYGLKHLLIIEEAHRLLKNVSQERQSEQLGNPRGKAVEFFANVISEMRSTGQGVVVVEQIPSKILPDVIKNTNAKIVHRLVAADDQALLSSSIGLNPEEAIYLTSLNFGHMLYLKEGMQRPVEIAVDLTIPPKRVSHEKIKKEMKLDKMVSETISSRSIEIRNVLSNSGEIIILRTFCSMVAGGKLIMTKLLDVVHARIKQELLLKNHSYSKQMVNDYLSNRLIALLALGIFQVNEEYLIGIGNDIKAVINGKLDSIESLFTRLSKGWGSNNATNGLINRLNELILDRIRPIGLKHTDNEKIEKIVKSYFLIDVPEVSQKTLNNINEKLKGMTWQ